jgi:hypothetical protein
MNKKAVVIGKTITSFVTITMVILIMGTFVFLASGISTLRKPEMTQASQTAQANSLLLKKITLPEENKKATILEAIIEGTLSESRYQQLNQQITSSYFKTENERQIAISEKNNLSNRMHKIKLAIATAIAEENKGSKENICLIVFQSDGKAVSGNLALEANGKDLYLKIENGKVEESYNKNDVSYYEKNNLLKKVPTIKATGFGLTEDFSIRYYYGACQNE